MVHVGMFLLALVLPFSNTFGGMLITLVNIPGLCLYLVKPSWLSGAHVEPTLTLQQIPWSELRTMVSFKVHIFAWCIKQNAKALNNLWACNLHMYYTAHEWICTVLKTHTCKEDLNQGHPTFQVNGPTNQALLLLSKSRKTMIWLFHSALLQF